MRITVINRTSSIRGCFVSLILICGCILLHTSRASAFDGHRKGFVLGGNIGYAPVLDWKAESAFSENGAGVAVGFLIGYAFDDKSMLVWQPVAGVRSTDMLDEDDHIAIAFAGPQYYRYFGALGRSLYATAGIGVVNFVTPYRNVKGDGFGITLGAGYEFAKQVQFGIQYFGATTSGYGIDHRVRVLQINLTVIAY